MADIESNPTSLPATAPTTPPHKPDTYLDEKKQATDGTASVSAQSLEKDAHVRNSAMAAEHDEEEAEVAQERRHTLYTRFRPFILGGLGLLILAWWISATVLQATRHRWYVSQLCLKATNG